VYVLYYLYCVMWYKTLYIEDVFNVNTNITACGHI